MSLSKRLSLVSCLCVAGRESVGQCGSQELIHEPAPKRHVRNYVSEISALRAGWRQPARTRCVGCRGRAPVRAQRRHTAGRAVRRHRADESVRARFMTERATPPICGTTVRCGGIISRRFRRTSMAHGHVGHGTSCESPMLSVWCSCLSHAQALLPVRPVSQRCVVAWNWIHSIRMLTCWRILDMQYAAATSAHASLLTTLIGLPWAAETRTDAEHSHRQSAP